MFFSNLILIYLFENNALFWIHNSKIFVGNGTMKAQKWNGLLQYFPYRNQLFKTTKEKTQLHSNSNENSTDELSSV